MTHNLVHMIHIRAIGAYLLKYLRRKELGKALLLSAVPETEDGLDEIHYEVVAFNVTLLSEKVNEYVASFGYFI